MKKISDEMLLIKSKKLVLLERKITVRILEVLREIELRSMHLKMGYGSLLEFCVKELQYSESAAMRRIQAMRFSKDVPDVKDLIKKGEINLSNISKAQSFSRIKKLNKIEKRELVSKIKNKSTRETEKLLCVPADLPKEKMRVLTNELTEIKFVANEELVKKLERLKGLLAHRCGNLGEIIEYVVDLGLEKVIKETLGDSESPNAAPAPVAQIVKGKHSRYISVVTKKQIWRRALGICEYVDLKTKRRCCSNYALQIHHQIPFGKGGDNSNRNLMLLCRNHNLMYAKLDYGNGMTKYLESS